MATIKENLEKLSAFLPSNTNEHGGTNSRDLYKEGMIDYSTDESAQQSRKKWRKFTEKFMRNIVKMFADQPEKQQKEIELFLGYYSEVYQKNDFTLASIYEGTKTEKITLFNEGLKICKEFSEKQTQQTPTKKNNK